MITLHASMDFLHRTPDRYVQLKKNSFGQLSDNNLLSAWTKSHNVHQENKLSPEILNNPFSHKNMFNPALLVQRQESQKDIGRNTGFQQTMNIYAPELPDIRNRATGIRF